MLMEEGKDREVDQTVGTIKITGSMTDRGGSWYNKNDVYISTE